MVSSYGTVTVGGDSVHGTWQCWC